MPKPICLETHLGFEIVILVLGKELFCNFDGRDYGCLILSRAMTNVNPSWMKTLHVSTTLSTLLSLL